MHAILAAFAFVAAVPAAAPAVPDASARAPDPTEPIVVTGIRPQAYRDRLADCLARKCPPDEDVDASLALAEALFLNGDYGEGRRVVRGSIDRNRRHARSYPEPVSDLYRAHARLSRHLGRDDQAARSTDEILRMLRVGLPEEDHRHFTARLEIADLQMAMGNATRARRELADLARIARGAGREDVAAMAELRTMWFDYLVFPHGETKKRLAALAEAAGPADRLRATGAKVLLARIHRSEGDHERADALLAEVGRGSSVRRRLISSPSYALHAQEKPSGLEMVTSAGSKMGLNSMIALGGTIGRMPDNYRDKWIDAGFWIMPDGRVSGLEVVRRSGGGAWADPLLEAIAGRLYSTADEPTYRLERYTYTASYETATGSRMQQQSPRARVEYLDLTANAPPAPPR